MVVQHTKVTQKEQQSNLHDIEMYDSNHITYIRVRVGFGVDTWDLLTAVITLRAHTHEAYSYIVHTRSPLPPCRLRTLYDPFDAGGRCDCTHFAAQ
jgi:hypothetical protein